MQAIELEKLLGSKKKKNINDLARFIKNRNNNRSPNFCLFLGAGASSSSGINTGSELISLWRDDAIKELSAVDASTMSTAEKVQWLSENAKEWYDPRKEYSCLFEYKYHLPRHRRIFIEKEVEGKLPSIGYAYLVRITESYYLRTLFTTNFDDLLNEAFYQFSTERPIVCAHDSSITNVSITSPRTKIIKLHGDYLFDNIKASQRETESLDKNTRDKLHEFLKEYGLIIAGYSGGDESVMQSLSEAASNPNYLRHGLCWCFRPTDVVNDEVLKLLRRDASFFMIVDGFDSLMAELHTILCGEILPFNSRIASDRATKVIESYLNNKQLQNLESATIRLHLNELDKDRKGSLLIDALHALHSESQGKEDVTDAELLAYLSIQRLLQARDYEGAINKIRIELTAASDKKLKKTLLERLYYCCRMVYRSPEALKAAEDMLALEPDNIYVVLSKCRVLQDSDAKLKLLQDAHAAAPYSVSALNQLCTETRLRYEAPTSIALRPSIKDVITLYQRSTIIRPSIDNAAWRRMFDFVLENESKAEERNGILENIIDEHIKQDAYSEHTLRLIVQYCKTNQTRHYKERDLFNILNEAFDRHFPRQHATQFAIYADACLEFSEHDRLLKTIERCCTMSDMCADEEFISTNIDLAQDFYRDADAAIRLGEYYLKRHRSQLIEEDLIGLYISEGHCDKAYALLPKLRGLLTESEYIKKESEILEAKGLFQDAIDKIRGIPDKVGFAENYTTHISYLLLKMGEFDKAHSECKALLDKHHFDLGMEAELINYEFSRKKRKGGKVDRRRLTVLAESARDFGAKAAAKLLLEDHEAAFKILKDQSEKRFSNLTSYLGWPVLEDIKPRLLTLRDELLKNRRSVDQNPAFLKSNTIDV